MDTVWIVGKFIAETDAGNVWDFQGVFLSREDAVSACASRDYFTAPQVVGKSLPDETCEWPGVEYPLA